jgi:predicted nucleic acid-binding protein
MVVFDTPLLIDASRKEKYVYDVIDSYSGKERIATTIITKYEMLRGASKRNVNFILELLNQFVVLDFDKDAADEAVEAYKILRGKGKMISELDFLIVGIATANNETLITKDKDFLKLETNKIIVLGQR